MGVFRTLFHIVFSFNYTTALAIWNCFYCLSNISEGSQTIVGEVCSNITKTADFGKHRLSSDK